MYGPRGVRRLRKRTGKDIVMGITRGGWGHVVVVVLRDGSQWALDSGATEFRPTKVGFQFQHEEFIKWCTDTPEDV